MKTTMPISRRQLEGSATVTVLCPRGCHNESIDKKPSHQDREKCLPELGSKRNKTSGTIEKLRTGEAPASDQEKKRNEEHLT